MNAANLASSDATNLTELLQPVLDLGLPVVGVVTDGQKSIRKAVASLFPGVPRQLCHFHFLRDIALPVVNEDRALKTDLKHELRGIKQVEQAVGSGRMWRPKSSRAAQQQTWLRHINTILDPARVKLPYVLGPERAHEAAWELWACLLRIQHHAVGNPSHDNFAGHVSKWVKNWGSGLFACFVQPLLPRTNNDLERLLRSLKGQHRRITGRQSWSRYILRYGAQLAFHDRRDCPAAVLQRLRLVRYQDFRQSRNYWRSSQEAIVSLAAVVGAGRPAYPTSKSCGAHEPWLRMCRHRLFLMREARR